MKNSKARMKICRTLLVLLLALPGGLAAATLSLRAKAPSTITVTNSSSREINHLYTSPTDRKEWSADQLPDGSTIQTGQSFTLSNVVSENDQIKVIAEDKEGCFMYMVISGQEPATWTINNSTPRDCGN